MVHFCQHHVDLDLAPSPAASDPNLVRWLPKLKYEKCKKIGLNAAYWAPPPLLDPPPPDPLAPELAELRISVSPNPSKPAASSIRRIDYARLST